MLSDELNERLDRYSERYGVSKSSIVGFLVGQWLDQVERMNSVVYGSLGSDGLIKEFFKQFFPKEEKNQNKLVNL